MDETILQIPLVGRRGVTGEFATIDIRDAERVKEFVWHKTSTGYAAATTYDNGWRKPGTLLMHRLIVAPKDENCVDHKNGNRLDNRRENLRECTQTQNRFNQGARKDSTSGIKGVMWDKRRKKYLVQIKDNKKTKSLGRFENIKDAERVYTEHAKKIQGEFFYEG